MITRWGAAVLLLGLLAGCGEESGPPEGADQTPAASPSDSTAEEPTDETTTPQPSETVPGSTSGSTPAEDPGTRIVAADSEFGQMLFDATGQAIYLFDVETTSKPGCYDACAEAWPPVLTDGRPRRRPGVGGSLLATTNGPTARSRSPTTTIPCTSTRTRASAR